MPEPADEATPASVSMTVRLPAPLRDKLNRAAELRGLTPSEILRRVLERMNPELKTAVDEAVPVEVCSHWDVVNFPYGLSRCKSCGATLGLDGIWRLDGRVLGTTECAHIWMPGKDNEQCKRCGAVRKYT